MTSIDMSWHETCCHSAFRQSRVDPVATLWQQGSPVQSIAFDDPWLAAALDDGSALLLNADAAMRGGRSGMSLASCDHCLGCEDRIMYMAPCMLMCMQSAHMEIACMQGAPGSICQCTRLV